MSEDRRTGGTAVVVPASRRKVASLLALCGAFTAAGVFLLIAGSSDAAHTAGIIGIAFFGGGGLAVAFLMLTRFRPLRIDADGIQGVQISEPIAWRDVTQLALAATTTAGHAQWMLTVYVAEAAARKPAKRELLVAPVPGSLSVTIPLNLLARDHDEIVAVVERFSGLTVERGVDLPSGA